jgi:hypothetical protein
MKLHRDDYQKFLRCIILTGEIPSIPAHLLGYQPLPYLQPEKMAVAAFCSIGHECRRGSMRYSEISFPTAPSYLFWGAKPFQN